LQDYNGYFDESYENFIKELKTKINDVSTVIALLDQYEKNVEKLDKLFTKYEKILKGLLFEKFDFSIIKNDFTELEKALKTKNDNIQSISNKPNHYYDNLTKLNEVIIKLQNLKTNISDVLKSKKLDTGKLEDAIRNTYKEIVILEFNNSNNGDALKKYRDNTKRILAIADSKSEGLPFLTKYLREELKKLKADQKLFRLYCKNGNDILSIGII
jgi:chromosome segregation ATPase